MKKIFILLLVFVLVGCVDPGSEEVTTSLTTQTEEISTNSNSSNGGTGGNNATTQLEEVTTPTVVDETSTIAQILEDASTLVGVDNGIVVGNRHRFIGKYISYYVDNFDRVALFSDGTDYIYVRISQENWQKKYLDSVYQVEGNICSYYNHIEMEISSIWTLSSTTVDVDVKLLASEVDSIEDLYTTIYSLPRGKKGTVFTNVIKFRANYIATLATSKVYLLYDGENVIQLHSNNSLSLSINKEYVFYGLVGIYIHKPSIEFIAIESGEDKTVEVVPAKTVTASNFYNMDVDEERGEYFPYILSFSGYVGYDNSNLSKFIYAFVDNFGDRVVQQSSYISKALYVHNYEDYAVDDMLYDYAGENIKIDVTFVLYQYVSQKHAWNVYLLIL